MLKIGKGTQDLKEVFQDVNRVHKIFKYFIKTEFWENEIDNFCLGEVEFEMSCPGEYRLSVDN